MVDSNAIRNVVEKVLASAELTCSSWLDDDGNLVLDMDDMKEAMNEALETYSCAVPSDDWKVV